jgi:hypothetical protein
MALNAEHLGYPPGRLDFDGMALAILKRQGIEAEALLLGDGERRGRIDPAAEQDDCWLWLSAHLGS